MMTALLPVTAGPWSELGPSMRYRRWLPGLWSPAVDMSAAVVDEDGEAFIWNVLGLDGRELARGHAASLVEACRDADVVLRAYCVSTGG